MSMWMLTDERKNELLKQRDNKLSELGELKSKTPESLWLADLEALEKKLDEVEEKERQEELGVNLKTSKQLAAKQAATGKRKRSTKVVQEIYPAADGIKIKFKVTDEILKKYEKMAAAGARAKAKKEAGGEGAEGVDEFDNLVNKVKKEPGQCSSFIKFNIKMNIEIIPRNQILIVIYFLIGYFSCENRKATEGAKSTQGAKSEEGTKGKERF